MKASQLKEKYIKFFKSKGHQEIPSVSLIPQNDPTTLFISAGMQQLVPYFTGTPHPLGKKITDIQKCVRTGDIDEVGDQTHHTFFEMLGNWSLGDYFKKEAIEWSFEFLTKELKIDINRLSVTCFEGDKNSPKDEVSANLWQSLGVKNIKFLGKKDNWWEAGSVGPCGPDTEMFVDGVEIWNNVFLEYSKDSKGNYSKLSQQNVDTGMGVERTTAFLNGFSDNYLTDIWQPIIKEIEKLCSMEYGPESDDFYIKDGKQCWVDVRKSMRIIADHIRSAVFIIADGVDPSNKEAGYVLRRLIRRAIRQGKIIGIENNFCSIIAKAVLNNQDNYAGVYPELNQNKNKILSTIETEENKFRKTLDRGLNEIKKDFFNESKITEGKENNIVDTKYLGNKAFYFYESFGFPIEMFLEETLVKSQDKNEVIKYFEQAKLDHQKLSQTLSAGKFKSGLADNSEVITKYHTATHLLHTALRQILGTNVQQSGSNITSERLRFDFSAPDKLTDDQLKQIEDLVNKQIKLDLPVTVETMPFSESQQLGAIAFFANKYPEVVTVYTIGDFSKEVCTGPHVSKLSQLGKFEITKEESAGSGKRRIYAVLK